MHIKYPCVIGRFRWEELRLHINNKIKNVYRSANYYYFARNFNLVS